MIMKALRFSRSNPKAPNTASRTLSRAFHMVPNPAHQPFTPLAGRSAGVLTQYPEGAYPLQGATQSHSGRALSGTMTQAVRRLRHLLTSHRQFDCQIS